MCVCEERGIGWSGGGGYDMIILLDWVRKGVIYIHVCKEKKKIKEKKSKTLKNFSPSVLFVQ